MSNDEHAFICQNPECQRDQTGICHEGHQPIEACPYLSINSKLEDDNDYLDDDYDDEEEDLSSSDSSNKFFHLGDALTSEELDLFLRKKDIRLISIIGDSDSGKTTLICSLYEKFLKGEFSDLAFKGSRTLYGFEKRVHYSRTESGATVADTARTSYSDGIRFFHLSLLSRSNDNKEINFMISDRAGEVYQNARSNPAGATDLFEIKKAKIVALLVDGRKIADRMQRVNVTQLARQTLRVLVENQMVDHATEVHILFTKIDLLLGADEAANHAFIDSFFEKIYSEYSSRVAALKIFKIAARATDGGGIREIGISELLTDWRQYETKTPRKVVYKFEPETQFDRLLLRSGIII